MFGGNAKTNFQVIGRSEATGYMMSPFGDERWDVDDNEKLNKVYKKKNFANNNYYNNYDNPAGNYQQQQSSYRLNQPSAQDLQKQHYYGYIHQSGTAQGYMPRTEISDKCPSTQPQSTQHYYQQSNYQQNQASYPLQPQPQQITTTTSQSSYYSYRPEVSAYSTSVAKHNGLNQDDIKQRSRVTYSQPLRYETQSLSRIPSVCERCQNVQTNRKSQDIITAKNWKASMDVPVLIAGEMGYKPFGPEATPNPFYPPRVQGMYTPLR